MIEQTHPIINFILDLLRLYSLGLFVYIIAQILIFFEIINRNNLFVLKLMESLQLLYEPFLKRIRNILPKIGAIDFSPILLFMLINLMANLIGYYS